MTEAPTVIGGQRPRPNYGCPAPPHESVHQNDLAGGLPVGVGESAKTGKTMVGSSRPARQP